MNLSSFTQTLVANGFVPSVHDSTNAWGEGSIGTRYVKGSAAVLVARARCRWPVANTEFVTVTLSEPGKHTKAKGRVADYEQGPKVFANILRGLTLDGFVQPAA